MAHRSSPHLSRLSPSNGRNGKPKQNSVAVDHSAHRVPMSVSLAGFSCGMADGDRGTKFSELNRHLPVPGLALASSAATVVIYGSAFDWRLYKATICRSPRISAAAISLSVSAKKNPEKSSPTFFRPAVFTSTNTISRSALLTASRSPKSRVGSGKSIAPKLDHFMSVPASLECR